MPALVQNNIAAWKKGTLDPAVTIMLNKMGSAVAEEARRLCPVDTGQLKASIGYTVRQSDKTVQIHADMPYAYFVEWGTRNTRAQPFLRPAILAARSWATRSVNTEMQFSAPSSSGRQPYPKANAAAIRHNETINRGLGSRFKGVKSLIHKRPSIVFHGRTAASQTGRMTHPIRERYS